MPGEYLRDMFTNPWAIRMFTVGKSARRKVFGNGQYICVVRSADKDKIAQEAFKERRTGSQG